MIYTNTKEFFIKANLAGESWLGLDKLHRLTSEASFGLKIVLTDFDGKRW